MRYFAILMLWLLPLLANSQVEIIAEQDQYKNLTLIAFNKESIPYTIRIEFVKLENLESLKGNVIYATAERGKTNLVKLQSVYGNAKTSFHYNTKLYKGIHSNGEPSADFAYLIPLEEKITVSSRPLILESSGKPRGGTQQPYVGNLFLFEKPTLVVAPRKGIISDMKMDAENPAPGPSSPSSENFIEIYHQDGTFTRLMGLAPNSAKVGLGDTVIPGQHIASSGIADEPNKYQLKMIQSRWIMGEKGLDWTNFPVRFFTSNGSIGSDETVFDLKVEHPLELITAEMDKKELKKLSGK